MRISDSADDYAPWLSIAVCHDLHYTLAHTLISTSFEFELRSHTANVFRECFVDRGGKWRSLNDLREHFENGTEDLLVDEPTQARAPAPKFKAIVPPAWFSGAATRVVSNRVWEWAEIWDTRSKQWDSTNVRFTTAGVKAGRPLSSVDYGILGTEDAPVCP